MFPQMGDIFHWYFTLWYFIPSFLSQFFSQTEGLKSTETKSNAFSEIFSAWFPLLRSNQPFQYICYFVLFCIICNWNKFWLFYLPLQDNGVILYSARSYETTGRMPFMRLLLMDGTLRVTFNVHLHWAEARATSLPEERIQINVHTEPRYWTKKKTRSSETELVVAWKTSLWPPGHSFFIFMQCLWKDRPKISLAPPTIHSPPMRTSGKPISGLRNPGSASHLYLSSLKLCRILIGHELETNIENQLNCSSVDDMEISFLLAL